MKTVVVTGSKQGIGKAIAEQLASLGFNIVLNDKENKKKLESVEKEIAKKYNVQTLSCFGDVSDNKFVDAMLKQVKSKFGKVFAVVNNAAVVEDMPLAKRNLAKFNKTLLNNVSSVFAMSKIFGKHMMENKEGRIINVSSSNSLTTFYPTSVDYDASKAAVNNITMNFAIELSPYVLVNAVLPRWVNTDMNQQLDDKFKEEERERLLLKRFIEPKEVAYLVEFLISDKASGITGAIIPIDGGI